MAVKSPSDTLLAAADVLRERGRCRVVMMNSEGAVCPLGAIAKVRGFTDEQILEEGEDVWRAVRKDPAVHLLAKELPGRGVSHTKVWYWNDDILYEYASAEDAAKIMEAAALA